MIKHPQTREERRKLNKAKGRRKMVTRNLELSVSKSNINDQVAALLYSLGYIKDSEEIVDIQIDGIKTDIIPLKIKLKKEGELVN